VVECSGEGFLEGFPARFVAGRYHSLFAVPEALPACLVVRARTEEGVIMAVEHETYPAAAVQFHPESILTLKEDLGLKLIARVVERLAKGGAG
jgi:anthranilate synthase